MANNNKVAATSYHSHAAIKMWNTLYRHVEDHYPDATEEELYLLTQMAMDDAMYIIRSILH